MKLQSLCWSDIYPPDLTLLAPPVWFYSNINSICAEEDERCSVNWVQQTTIYQSRQLSWSLWRHRAGCVQPRLRLHRNSEDAVGLLLPIPTLCFTFHSMLTSFCIYDLYWLVHFICFLCRECLSHIQTLHSWLDTGQNGRYVFESAVEQLRGLLVACPAQSLPENAGHMIKYKLLRKYYIHLISSNVNGAVLYIKCSVTHSSQNQRS